MSSFRIESQGCHVTVVGVKFEILTLLFVSAGSEDSRKRNRSTTGSQLSLLH